MPQHKCSIIIAIVVKLRLDDVAWKCGLEEKLYFGRLSCPVILRDTHCRLGDELENSAMFDLITKRALNKDTFYRTLKSDKVWVL